MDNNEFMKWFGDITSGNNNKNNHWSDEDELNSLWKEYNDFVQSLKDDGYKVLRNENGKHKLIKL